MAYTDFVKENIDIHKIGEPIYTNIIAQNLAKTFEIPMEKAIVATAIAVRRLINNKRIPELRFFQKGIYYKTQMTPFGEAKIDKNALISDKYLFHNTGYETSYTFLHHIGLTTQMPVQRFISTNKATDCIRKDKILDVVICPPKTNINSNNKLYLQLLDAIEMIKKAPIDAENPYRLIAEYIKKMKLDYGELLSIAGEYYNKETICALARIAKERK